MAQIKLYPPTIEGTLPAFYKRKSGSAVITIPFSVNRATNKQEVAGMELKLKYINKEEIIANIQTTSINFTTQEAKFTISKDIADKMNVGQYYKAQVAFVNNDTVGYYSTVGIIKCVAKPRVYIDGYNAGNANAFNNEIIGVYKQDLEASEGDNTEKVYSYRFDMWNGNDELVMTTGDIVHNTSEDTEYNSSRDVLYTNKYLRDNEIGHIQYTVKTLNGLMLSTPKYRIMRVPSIDMVWPLMIYPKLNFDEGYIEIQLGYDNKSKKAKKRCTGKFLIMRGSAQDDYFEWNEIARFNMNNDKPDKFSFRDFTIEQGITYIYSLQQYNDYGVYSNRKFTDTIYADFEDMFLYDGTRQLKVKFNPKVSSFKPNIPEQKTDTIGSKFPYFFRNGKVNYKEFPIAGLISYWMDEAILFLQGDEPVKGDILRDDVHRGTSVSQHWDSNISHPYFDTNETSWRYTTTHENLQGLMYQPGEKLYNLYQQYDTDNPDQILIDVINQMLVSAKENGVITEALQLPEDNDTIQNNIDNIREQWQYGTGIQQPEINYARYNIERPELKYQNSQGIIKTRDAEHNENTQSMKRVTDLLSDNIMSERYFKLKVLEWLTDGKPKLFRSPGEGNYIVRLMNSSLTPIDSLGRMLHNFQCTAYEMADYTYDNLIKFGIVKIVDLPNEAIKFASEICKTHGIGQNDESGEQEISNKLLLNKRVQTLQFEDFEPGDDIYINLLNPTKTEHFIIGSTGALLINNENCEIESIQIKQVSWPGSANTNYYGEQQPFYSTDFHRLVHYSYIDKVKSKFDEVRRIMSYTLIGKQYIGARDYSPMYNIIDGMLIGASSTSNSQYYDLVAQKTKEHIPYSLIQTDVNTIYEDNGYLPCGLTTILTKNLDGGFGYKTKLLNVERIVVQHRNPHPVYSLDNTSNKYMMQVNHYSEDSNYFIAQSERLVTDNGQNSSKLETYYTPIKYDDREATLKAEASKLESKNRQVYELYTTTAEVYDGSNGNDNKINMARSKIHVGGLPISYATCPSKNNNNEDINKQLPLDLDTMVDIDDTIELDDLGPITKLIVDKQLITTVVCQLQVIDYSFEDENINVNDLFTTSTTDNSYRTNWHNYIATQRTNYRNKIERVYGIE